MFRLERLTTLFFAGVLAVGTSTMRLGAQIRSGAITGAITDPSGDAIAGAKISAIQAETQAAYNTTTGASGEYTVPYLQSGTYTITVEASGFPAFRVTDIHLETAQTVRANAQLHLGTVSTQLEVSATTAGLQTESSTVQGAVDQRVIETIPNINHNPFYYATLLPGVVPRSETVQTQSINSFGIGIDGRRTFSAISANGAQAFTNDIQLDGVSVQGSAWNEAAVIPNPEGVQEVRVLTNTFTAEYGRAQGVLQVTTKSGTNSFHGSGFYRLRNEALNANTFGNNMQGISRSPFKANSYGGTFGGPVRKDKLFFFVSYEGLQHTQAINYLETVPTALEKQGNFSKTLANVNGVPTPIQIFNPFAITQIGANQYQRDALPGSVIPTSLLDPAMVKLFSYYPLPNNTPSDVYNTGNYFNRGIQDFGRNSVNSRIDYRIGKHSIYGTGGITKDHILSPGPWGSDNPFYSYKTLLGTAVFLGQTVSDQNPYAAIGDTIALSPTLVADIRYGFNRINANNLQNVNPSFDYSSFGISPALQAINPAPGAPIEYEGGTGISALNNSNSLHKKERQLNHDLVGSVTKVISHWTLKAGAEQRIYLSNYTDNEESFQLVSSPAYTNQFINATGGTVGSPLANAAGWMAASTLLGAGYVHIAAGRGVQPALAQKYTALYSQNDWHATPKLTINLGLRWEVQPGPTERYNQLTAFAYGGTSPFGGAGGFTFPGSNGFSRNLWATNWKDFGPRAGFAYRFGDSTVIRGGYGITYLPTNTGYFDGPFAYGQDTFSPSTNGAVYGANPAGLVVGTLSQTTQIIPACANANCPGLYGNPNPRFDAYNYKDGMAQQWNLFLERSFGTDWLVSAGYSASKGSHLPFARIPLNSSQFLSPTLLASWQQSYVASNGKSNPSTVQVANPFQPKTGGLLGFNGDFANATISTLESLYSYPLFGGMTPERSIGFSDYNSLQLSVQRRLKHGLQFMASYTWSKSIDMTQTEAQTNGFSDTGGYDQTNLDLLNYGNNKKLSTTDVPYRFVISAVYDLPFGKGKMLQTGNRIADTVIGGWRLGGVAILQSGFPVEISGGSGSINGRPNLVAGAPIEVPKALQHWYDGKTTVTLPNGQQITPCNYCYLKYDLGAFQNSVVQTPNGTYSSNINWWGTSALDYSSIRGPGRSNLDLSLEREFRIHEGLTLDISAHATNFLNHTEPIANAFSLSLGGVNVTPNAAMGVVPGSFNNSSFGAMSNATYDPRQIEFEARIRF